MTSARATRLVLLWVRLYTRGVPAAAGRRRIEEIASDLHDQAADERRRGVGELRLALLLLGRAARGLPADVAWRAPRRPASGPAARILLGSAALLLVPLAAMLVTSEVSWGPGDFAAAFVLLATTGLGLRAVLRARRPRRHRAVLAVACLGALLVVWASLAVGLVGEPDRVETLLTVALAGGAAVGASRRLRPSR